MGLSIFKIREFINQERAYMLMLSFIILFNALIIFSEKIPETKEDVVVEKVLQRYEPAEEFNLEYSGQASEQILWEEALEKESQLPIFINILGIIVLSVFSLGLFLDIRILMARVKKREILQAPGPRLPINWGLRDIFKIIIIFVFLSYILHIIEAFILLGVPEEGTFPLIPLLNTGIMDLVLLGFIIYFIKVKFNSSLAVIGLKIKNAFKLIFLAVLGYIAFLPILTFLLVSLILLAAFFNYHPQQQMLLKFFLQEEKLWFLIYSTVMAVILGPIVEEVFFRGFAYNAIKKRWGVTAAIMLTAVVFAGLHGTLFGFFPIMALGILLAYVYEKTDSLIPSIVIHILHNGMMLALLFSGRYFLQSTQ